MLDSPQSHSNIRLVVLDTLATQFLDFLAFVIDVGVGVEGTFNQKAWNLRDTGHCHYLGCQVVPTDLAPDED